MVSPVRKLADELARAVRVQGVPLLVHVEPVGPYIGESVRVRPDVHQLHSCLLSDLHCDLRVLLCLFPVPVIKLLERGRRHQNYVVRVLPGFRDDVAQALCVHGLRYSLVVVFRL